MPVSPLEHTVALPGLRLSVRDHAGASPPVVALHGLASNARWWDLVAERVAPAHRLIAVDQRGHGRSDRPDQGYGFAEVVDDVHNLVEALDLSTAVVVGHSWGGSVALAYAATHPDAVLGVVCVDGGFLRVRDHFGESWDLASVAMRPPEMHGLTPARVRQWMAASALSEGANADVVTEIMLGNLEPDPSGEELRPRLHVDRHMQIARALWAEDPDALLRAQRRPVLLIPAGAEDAVLAAKDDAVARSLAALGRLGSVEWIDGEHDLPVQRPAEVAGAISTFIAALTGGGRVG